MANVSVMEKEEDSRRALLESCEKRIISAFRRGMDVSRAIAKELININDQELFLVYYDSFKDYVDDRLQLSYTSALRIMDIQRTMELFEDAKLELLPANETQVAELGRLPLGHRAKAWNAAVEICKDRNLGVTAYAVRSAVDITLQEIKQIERNDTIALPPRPTHKTRSPSERKPKEKRGLDITLDDDGEDNGAQAELKERVSLSEEGERALDRIRRICGDPIANAIESGRIKITERHLIRWAEEKDEIMENLAYYVVDMGWNFQRALSWEKKLIDGNTTVDELTLRAQACGGRVSTNYQAFRITIELVGA
jgi:hypothetical protein